MDADASVSVTHGLGTGAVITGIQATIFNDSGGIPTPLDLYDFLADNGTVSGGVGSISSSALALFRKTGGLYDGTSFNATGFNRGYVTIRYRTNL
jgi:hypothetical protein